MSSQNLVDLAIQFNDGGVQLMNQGRFINAIPYFHKALNHLKQVLGAQDGSKTSTDDLLTFQMAGAESASSKEQESFIFTTPITASRADQRTTMLMEEDTDTCLDSLVRFSFSLLFNLAVAMHIGGLDTPNMEVAERRVKKSLVFYELAYNMMQDERIHGLTETMAIINNIAQVHRVLGNPPKAHQCYEKLLSIMVYVTDCGGQLSVHQFDRFYENVLPALLPRAPVAQAA
ncbi:expressed unknown protein [Seminavis robusta]|uniref:Uncharacterized protein n=1 Tax=Seminavis robusta TaxID=568900 RepID=A0A9N8E0E9_9STRA|nr:expressed unknown protein [Seminavis robusta]|eukprot:Sro525_g160120.1 n/a (231) ;mRNA; f:22107-22799